MVRFRQAVKDGNIGAAIKQLSSFGFSDFEIERIKFDALLETAKTETDLLIPVENAILNGPVSLKEKYLSNLNINTQLNIQAIDGLEDRLQAMIDQINEEGEEE